MTTEATPQKSRKIGDMNGPWAVMLRIALGTYPMVLAWGVWVTVQEFESKAFREQGNRFTATDGVLLESRINERLASLPPVSWQTRIINMEENQLDIIQRLARIEAKLEK